jgi:signal transduction histidine kinase
MTLLPTGAGAAPAPLVMVEDVTELHQARERRRVLEETLAAYTARLEELLDLIDPSLAPERQVLALLRLACRALGMVSAGLDLATAARTSIPIAHCEDGLPRQPPVPAPLLEAALAQPGRPVIGSGETLGAAAAAAGLGCCVALVIAGDGGDEHQLLVLWGRGETVALSDPLRQLLQLIAQRIAAVRVQDQMQRDLVRAKERETIGHLASGVAHDFNNLLGVIDANLFFIDASLGDLGGADPELSQVMEETRSALGQAKVVTSGMLSLSRAGGVPLAAVRLEQSIGELVAILRQVLPEGIALETDMPPDIEAWTNSAFLQSALLNLALNARDAMPRGGRLTIAARRRVPDVDETLAAGHPPAGDHVEISVTDTGGGIPPAILERIFEPLFSTKAKRRGHGLGLFMVREFVLRSGAGLAVESEPGRGTCFRLLLPAGPTGGRTNETVTHAPRGAEPGPATLAGLRVLVVDDDPRVRDAVARLLALEGIETVLAEDGQAALERLRGERGFDLVLSDVAMPILDGPTLRERLRQEQPGLPVLLMTGQDSALTEGGDRTLPPLRKPLEPAALRAAIRTLCRAGRG